MQEYWWLILAAAAIVFVIGAIMWMHAAADLVRVVSPSGDWLEKESRINTWGARLMMIGVLLAVFGIGMAIGHWANP